MDKGIDVSENNGSVNWERVAQDGFTFAYARATLGRESNDPTYAANRAGAKAHGIRFGGYHLPYPGNSSAEQQAEHFLSVAKPQPGDLVPAIDVENKTPVDTKEAAFSTDALVTWLRAWLAAVEAQIGAKPIVYTNPSWWSSRLQAADLTDHPLWLAHYTDGVPTIPPPWASYAIWQHSDKGNLEGHALDLNRCPDLDAVTIGSSASGPVLVQGDTGPAVVRLKALLMAWSAEHPPPAALTDNDTYGQAAVATVKRVQQAAGLVDTGEVDAKTWAALTSAKAPPKAPKAKPAKPTGPAKATTPAAPPPAPDAITGTHFALSEVIHNSGYTSLPADVLAAATRHAKNMERLRTELNRRRAQHNLPETGLSVISWARSPDHNHQVGGAKQSRHLTGDACDIAHEEIVRICPWPGGAADFDATAELIFADGGIGLYPAGNRHVDSRGSKARWTSFTPG